jgi:Flp pilus assembly protein TadB/Mg-chelatase subunit ChlD
MLTLKSAVASLGALAVLCVAAPASAETPSAVVEGVRPTQAGVEVDLRASNLVPGTDLDHSSLQVRIGDQVVESRVSKHAATEGARSRSRSVALVVDTSGSMKGARLVTAEQAGRTYLATVPEDVQVALITFAQRPTVVAPPGADRATVQAGLAGMVADGDTSLYDAVIKALATVQGAEEPRIIVLSDGEDTASTAGLSAAVEAVSRSNVGLDAVVLGEQPLALAALRELTAAGDGQVLEAASTADATAAFAVAARAFDTRLTLEAALPAVSGTDAAHLHVRLTTTTGEVLTAQRQILLPQRRVDGESDGSNGALLPVGLLVLFAGLAGTLVLLLRDGDSYAHDRRRTRDVLAAYSTRPPAVAPSLEGGSSLGHGVLVRTVLHFTNRVAARGAIGPRLSSKLERAGLRLTAGEWLGLHLIIGVLSLLLLLALTEPVVAIVGGALAAVAPHLWLNHKASARQTSFNEVMPDALQLISSGLASGYSLPQALDSVVREGQEPVAGEFGRALAEARLGVPVENALDAVADRMQSDDFRWVVMTIRVQRDVGGNLSEVLHTVCQTMRERASLRRQVAALSAEGRLSTWILCLLPVLLAAYLAFSAPEFFGPMYETGIGRALLSICAVALVLAALWMKKLVKVEM